MNGDNSRLAALGGLPQFRVPLHVGRPNIGDRQRFRKSLEGALDRRWLTNAGPLVQEFERSLAERLGVRHCVAVCNATVGLEILARALDLSGEVIVPAFTFVATAHALKWIGLDPVFCDVDPQTHCLDPACVEALISPRTSAIMGVHLWGRACPVPTLAALAQRHRLRLVFDAAHALGCSSGGRMIGCFGDAEVFSLHATKFVNAFEGGVITTQSDALAERVRLMRNFGFAGYDNVVSVGTNGKMNEASAAMGLASLASMGEFIEVNRRNYEAYERALGDLPGLRLCCYDKAERNNWQYVVIEVEEEAGLARDILLQVLYAENVIARRYFHPGVHRMEPYRSLARYAGLALPVTERLCDRVLVLPTGTAVTTEDIDRIGAIVAEAYRQADRLRACLPAKLPLGWPLTGVSR